MCGVGRTLCEVGVEESIVCGVRVVRRGRSVVLEGSVRWGVWRSGRWYLYEAYEVNGVCEVGR